VVVVWQPSSHRLSGCSPHRLLLHLRAGLLLTLSRLLLDDYCLRCLLCLLRVLQLLLSLHCPPCRLCQHLMLLPPLLHWTLLLDRLVLQRWGLPEHKRLLLLGWRWGLLKLLQLLHLLGLLQVLWLF